MRIYLMTLLSAFSIANCGQQPNLVSPSVEKKYLDSSQSDEVTIHEDAIGLRLTALSDQEVSDVESSIQNSEVYIEVSCGDATFFSASSNFASLFGTDILLEKAIYSGTAKEGDSCDSQILISTGNDNFEASESIFESTASVTLTGGILEGFEYQPTEKFAELLSQESPAEYDTITIATGSIILSRDSEEDAAEEPAADEVVEEPASDEVAEEPAADEAAEEPAADEAAEEPVADEAAEEPAADEAAEEPAAEEPASDEVAEEPAADEVDEGAVSEEHATV